MDATPKNVVFHQVRPFAISGRVSLVRRIRYLLIIERFFLHLQIESIVMTFCSLEAGSTLRYLPSNYSRTFQQGGWHLCCGPFSVCGEVFLHWRCDDDVDECDASPLRNRSCASCDGPKKPHNKIPPVHPSSSSSPSSNHHRHVILHTHTHHFTGTTHQPIINQHLISSSLCSLAATAPSTSIGLACPMNSVRNQRNQRLTIK